MGRLIVLAPIAADMRLGGVLSGISYGVAYSATLHQVGGTGTAAFTCTSTLPAGITFTDDHDGTLTFAGTSTDVGDFPIVINAIDAERNTATFGYTLRVQILPITLTGDAGDMRIGDAPDTYTGYAASGGSGTGYSWSITSGSLPPGWGPLNAATGHLPRNPTTVGAYAWGITVSDSLGNVSAVYADGATIRYPMITLTGAFASPGVIGVAYSSDITISGGDGAYSNPRFTSGAVSGMALSIVLVGGTYKLRLSGVPTSAETDSITVAVDAHEYDGSLVTATHAQSVTEDAALTLTGTFTATGTQSTAYQSDLLLGGGDGTFALANGGTGLAPGSGPLPSGLALSIVTVSGSNYLRLSGAPTSIGVTNFTVSVDSGDGQNVTSMQIVTINSFWTALDPASIYGGRIVLSNANLTANIAGNDAVQRAVVTVSGKSSGAYYWEVSVINSIPAGSGDRIRWGMCTETAAFTSGNNQVFGFEGGGCADGDGKLYKGNGTGIAGFGRVITGHILGFRADLGAGTLDVTPDGTSWYSLRTGLPAATYRPICSGKLGGFFAQGGIFNFGATAFTYAVPTGYTAGWPS